VEHDDVSFRVGLDALDEVDRAHQPGMGVWVAEAGVELDWRAVLAGDVERPVEAVVQEPRVLDPAVPRPADGLEGGPRVRAVLRADVQPAAVGGDRLQRDVLAGERSRDALLEGSFEGVEAGVLVDQRLDDRFETEHRVHRRVGLLAELRDWPRRIPLVDEDYLCVRPGDTLAGVGPVVDPGPPGEQVFLPVGVEPLGQDAERRTVVKCMPCVPIREVALCEVLCKLVFDCLHGEALDGVCVVVHQRRCFDRLADCHTPTQGFHQVGSSVRREGLSGRTVRAVGVVRREAGRKTRRQCIRRSDRHHGGRRGLIGALVVNDSRY